jgi:hypothetical protein
LRFVLSWLGRATAEAVGRREQSPTSYLHQGLGRVVEGLSTGLCPKIEDNVGPLPRYAARRTRR